MKGAVPKKLGPYSLGASARGLSLFFSSGETGTDPKTGKLEKGIAAQARRTLENIEAILLQKGLSRRNVVKATVYLTDLRNFAEFNGVYRRFFGESLPARTCVGVSELVGGAFVEVEVVASRKVGRWD
ncbi:MAG: Rid family detoxifying hydrolase [archaeon]